MKSLAEIAKKLKHSYKRHWRGRLSPSEFILLVENGAIPVAKIDLERAKERQNKGSSMPWDFGFDVKDGSPLDLILDSKREK